MAVNLTAGRLSGGPVSVLDRFAWMSSVAEPSTVAALVIFYRWLQ